MQRGKGASYVVGKVGCPLLTLRCYTESLSLELGVKGKGQGDFRLPHDLEAHAVNKAELSPRLLAICSLTPQSRPKAGRGTRSLEHFKTRPSLNGVCVVWH